MALTLLCIVTFLLLTIQLSSCKNYRIALSQACHQIAVDTWPSSAPACPLHSFAALVSRHGLLHNRETDSMSKEEPSGAGPQSDLTGFYKRGGSCEFAYVEAVGHAPANKPQRGEGVVYKVLLFSEASLHTAGHTMSEGRCICTFLPGSHGNKSIIFLSHLSSDANLPSAAHFGRYTDKHAVQTDSLPLLSAALAVAVFALLLADRTGLLSLPIFLLVLLRCGGVVLGAEFTYGGTGTEICYAMTPTNDGGEYLTGYTRPKGASGLDIWTIKVNETGALVWEQTAGTASTGIGYAIATTLSGGCIVAGIEYCNGGAEAGYIVVYSSTGSVLYESCLITTTYLQGVRTLKVNSGYAVVGVATTGYMYAARLSPELVISWESFNTTQGELNGVVEISDGSIAAVGMIGVNNAYGYILYNGVTGNVSYSVGQACGSYVNYMTTLLLLSDGNVLLVGTTNLACGSTYNVWMIKMTPAGTHVWDTVYGTSGRNFFPYSAIQLPTGNIVIVGSTMPSTGGVTNFFILKMDTNGAVVSANWYSSNSIVVAKGVDYRPACDHIVIGGYTASSSQYDYYFSNSIPVCAQGYYYDSMNCACYACSAGSYQGSAGMAYCSACPVGTYQDEMGASLCKSCPAGSYQSGTGATSYISCPAGTYQAGTGASSCDSCPAGYYQPLQGSVACILCYAGTVQPSSGQASCSACPAGTYQSSSGGIVCQDCPVGSFQSATGSTGCNLCVAGTIQPNKAQASCSACLAGTYQNSAGESVCKDCPAGFFQAATGSTACDACPVGTAQPASAQISCYACPAGTYQEGTGALTCKDCPIGSCQTAQGSSSCNSCLAGTFQASTGQTSCTPCSSGTHQSGTGASSCVSCSVGSYQNAEGSSTCSPCHAGTSQASTGKTACDPCPVGTYQSGTGGSSCQDCAAGSYQAAEGSSGCSACAPGTVQPDSRKTSCNLCGINQYQDEHGQSTCKTCGATTYQDETGAAACKPCLANCKTCSGPTDCSACLANHFMLTVGSTVSCNLPCPDQFYGDVKDYTCKCISSPQNRIV